MMTERMIRIMAEKRGYAENFLGMLPLGCCLILLRHLLRWVVVWSRAHHRRAAAFPGDCDIFPGCEVYFWPSLRNFTTNPLGRYQRPPQVEIMSARTKLFAILWVAGWLGVLSFLLVDLFALLAA